MAASWLAAAPPEEIDAGPVRLRRWHVEDAPVLARLVTDNLEYLRPWMAWASQAPTEAQERELLQRAHALWERLLVFAFGVAMPGAGLVGGMTMQAAPQSPGTLELGYWIAAACTGRGYATACAAALTDAGFALAGVERVEIRCDAGNQASVAVPRKLDFRLVDVVDRERAAPGHTGRGLVWAVTSAEWAAGRAR